MTAKHAPPSQRPTAPSGPDQRSTPERIPPQALDAEMNVLGAVLQDPAAFMAVRAILIPDDFYRQAHGRIFAAACDVADQRGEQVDLITVTNELRRAGTLEEVGTAAYLSSLVNATPTAANARSHARLVKRLAHARRTADLALRLYAAAMTDNGWRELLVELVEAAPSLAAHDEAPAHRRRFVTTPL